MTSREASSPCDLNDAKAMARQIIEHHFGQKPRRIEHKTSGLSNFVFEVIHPEGEFIVRICPESTKINSYLKEQWAIARAKKAGVPVPEILEVGNEAVPVSYMVARKVDGQEATRHPKRMEILREMGSYAARIHSIKTTGFGKTFDWSGNQLSHHDTWEEYLEQELELPARLETLAKHKMLSESQRATLRKTLESVGKTEKHTALNHGDLRLKNVMVDPEGKIVAILDWENCTSNLTPHWEFSLALHDLSIDEKQEFLVGYGIDGKKLIEIAPTIKALNLLNYAPQIEHLSEAKDNEGMERIRVRFSGALDLYSL